MAKEICEKCNSELSYDGKYIDTDGDLYEVWVCDNCEEEFWIYRNLDKE